MFNFDQEDRDRIARLMELIGIDGRVREGSPPHLDQSSVLIVEPHEVADWRDTLEENSEYDPKYLVDFDIKREGEFLSLLSANGYEFLVEPRFETPTRINIVGFDDQNDLEYQDLFIPAEIETRYQTHATETTSPAELTEGDTIIDPQTGDEVTVLNVHEADARTYIVAVGTLDTGDFIGQREYSNTDSVALPSPDA